MSQGSYSVTLRDYSKETSSTQFNIGIVTVLNYTTVLANAGTLRSAIDGITLGILAADNLVASGGPLDGSTPTDKNAQIEDKWLVVYHDNTQFLDAPVNAISNPGYQKSFRNEIPTPDRLLVVNNTDFVDLTVNPALAFVSAFQGFVKSPYGGTPVVDYIKYVGR